MNLDYSSIYKNFQSVIGSYQDIAAIYTKLFSQGQIQKLGAVINDIYDEEHVFTLTELQRYCRDVNQNEDNFVAEQYEMNSTIFRRNLSLIVQNLVDEIGKKFLESFRQDYLSTSGPNVNELPSEIPEQLSRENSEEKPQPKGSFQPEVAEPVEQHTQKPAYGTPAKTSSKSLTAEPENASTGNRSFDINMSEIAQKAKIQQIERTPVSKSANDVDNRIPRQHQQMERNQVHSNKKVTYATYEGAEKVSPAYTKAEASTIAFSEARVEDFSQYEMESGTMKQSQQGRASNDPRYKNHPDVNNFWSASERGTGNSRKNFYSNNRRDVNISSPERLQTMSNSMFGGSYSRWSSSNGRPDMSILDSEFSYGQGASFSKSPKRFHHHIQDVPGPGRYELDEAMQLTKSKAPVPGFPKSPKVPCYFKKSSVPGAIYYPTIHYISKGV